jgi:Zn-dependent M16 (insulinase) family peptidase
MLRATLRFTTSMAKVKMQGKFKSFHSRISTDRLSVVYAEMQARQNLQGDMMDLRMRRLLYPEDDGFRSETGGLMENLRVLTAERIREFHREMYQPKNMRLILIGEVDHANLLDVLDKFEDDIVDSVPSYDAPFKRPWVESKRTPPLSKTIVDTLEFPEEDESTGEVQIAFLGPKSTDDLAETAINTLLTYLAGSSVSVLVNTLVEKEHLASEVYYFMKDHYDSIIWFTLSAVDTEKLGKAEKRFFEVLREHVDGPLDMSYLRDCLHRFKRQAKFTSEVNNEDWNTPIVKDHIFGNRDGSDLKTGMADLTDFDELDGWSEDQWRSFTKKWISDAHHVTLFGKPSASLNEKMKAEEVARVKAQQEKLGEEGLKKLAEKLQAAQDQNNRPIPEELIASFKIPSTDSIHFFETTPARSGLAKKLGTDDTKIQQIIDKDENGLPLFVHYEHIPTSFVHFGLALGTSELPTELKPLIGLYLTNFFATPVVRDGKRIEFEEVITKLEQDTIEYTLGRATDIGNSEMLHIHFVAESEKFETVVRWLKTLLVDSVFDVERIKATVIRLLATVPEEKRDGNGMALAIDKMIHYDTTSSVRATTTLVKALYLKRTLKLLESDPQQVIDKLEALRRHLLKFSNMRVLVTANLETLQNPVSTFKHLTDAIKPESNPTVNPIDDRNKLLSDIGRNPGGAHYIVTMPIDTSYGIFTTAGPKGYTAPELPPLLVTISILEAVEGPMWVAIRGTGLAYGSSFYRDVETGKLKYVIYNSPNVYKAFAAAKKLIHELADGTKSFDKMALEGAISTIVRSFVDDRDTMVDAAKSSFIDLVVRGVDKDWQEWVLREVRKITLEDVKRTLKEVVSAIFEPEKVDVVVTCGGILKEVCASSSIGCECLLTVRRASKRTSKRRGSSLRARSWRTSTSRMVSRVARMRMRTTMTIARKAVKTMRAETRWKSRP